MQTLQYIQPAAAAASAIAIIFFAWHLKRTKLRWKLFILFLSLPLCFFLIYNSWSSTLIVAVLMLTIATFAIIPITTRIYKLTESDVSGRNFLALVEIITLISLIVFGIMLLVTVRDRAFRDAQMVEIKSRGIYAEISNLEDLAENPRLEFAKITDPHARFQRKRIQVFGSGEDSYTETYGMLVSKESDTKTWPLWYYCGSYDCRLKKPLFVSIDLCPNPVDCHADFAFVLKAIFQTEIFSNEAIVFPKNLRLLSEIEELGYSAETWWSMTHTAITGLAITQTIFTALYMLIVLLIRLHVR